MEIENLITKEIVAIIPVYLQNIGNGTIVYTIDEGAWEIPKTIKTVIRQLCEYFHLDLKVSRNYYGKILNIKNIVPLVLNDDYIFSPVKTRKPFTKNDGSTGYINVKYIDEIIETGDGTEIKMGDYTIKSLYSKATVNKNINNAIIIKKIFDKNRINNKKNDFYIDSDMPATKGDIALLIKEILYIKENIL